MRNLKIKEPGNEAFLSFLEFYFLFFLIFIFGKETTFFRLNIYKKKSSVFMIIY